MEKLTCIAIDDDSLFLRKIQAFVYEIEWIELIGFYDNPIKGATAILTEKPQLIFTDYEMPFVDGNYLLDWIKPKINNMTPKPYIILISGVTEPPQELMNNVSGFINKIKILDPQSFSRQIKKIIDK